MLGELLKNKNIHQALSKLFNVRYFFGIITNIWILLLLIMLFSLLEESFREIQEHIFGNTYFIYVIFILILLTVILSLFSPVNSFYYQKNIRDELKAYEEHLAKYNCLTEDQINQIHRNSIFFTIPFQKYLIENTLSDHEPELLKKIIHAELKNHILKEDLIWKSIRYFTSIAYFMLPFSFLFLAVPNGSDNKNILIEFVFFLVSYLLLLLHFYSCGYFSRRKTKTLSCNCQKKFSPWQYYEEIPSISEEEKLTHENKIGNSCCNENCIL